MVFSEISRSWHTADIKMQLDILNVPKPRLCIGFAVFWIRKLVSLKVPKREIFDRSDFPDFYTIKSRPEGNFGV